MPSFNEKKVRAHLRRDYPGCPDFAVAYFVREIMQRDWTNISIARAVELTIHQSLRHTMTDYDQLLLIGIDRGEARRRVQPKVNAMIAMWRPKSTIDVAILKPSDIERLRVGEPSEQDRKAILASIYRMTKERRNDNGAETDHVFMAAVGLSSANLWKYIDPADLAHALRDAEEGVRQAFLDGLPQTYATMVDSWKKTQPEFVAQPVEKRIDPRDFAAELLVTDKIIMDRLGK